MQHDTYQTNTPVLEVDLYAEKRMQQLQGRQGRLFVTLEFVAMDQWLSLPGLGLLSWQDS